ncbi:MAG: ribonuclease D [Acidobacteriota bacterium]
MGNDVILWVDSAAKLQQVCKEARAASVVAVDSEADSFHSYYPKVCLVQLSFSGRHAVVDTLKLSPQELAPLGELLADGQTLKVLHGADYDLRMLQKDFAFRLRNLADTQAAAQVLGEPQTSLAALVKKELGFELDKSQQRADWALRPLSSEMLRYAVDDTRYLEALLTRLKARLEALGRLEWWEEECQALEQVAYQPPDPDPWAFLRIKGARALSAEALGRLKVLWEWRESVAQALDVAPFRVLPSDLLLRLALNPPSDFSELVQTPGMPPRVARRWGAAILQVLAQVSEVTLPPASLRTRPDEARERLVKKLRAVRDQVAQVLALDPGFLAPRASLEAVADRRPENDQAWLECLKRRWRVAVLKEPLGKVLAET